MGQRPEEAEQQVVVIGEAAAAATLLLQKLNEYLGSNSNCGRIIKGCVHRELELIRCHILKLRTQFAEEEASRGLCYDNGHQSTGSEEDSLQQQQQEEYSWTREAKRIIYNIEDEVDQIMTIQYRNNLVPERLRCTFTNCCSLKKHLTALCCCSSSVRKHWTDIQSRASLKNHLAAIRKLSEDVTKSVSAAPTPAVDDNSAAICLEETMAVTGPGPRPGGDDAQDENGEALPQYMIPVIHVSDNKYLDDIKKFEEEDKKHLKLTIVVTGMAGIGKTFLARKTFGCEKYKWISYDPCVAMTVNMANLYEVLYLAECKGTADYVLQNMAPEELPKGIKSFLDTRRPSKYLRLVVDDVSDVGNVWNSLIRPVLPQGIHGSLIFISRNADTAIKIDHKVHPYPQTQILYVDQKLKQEEALDLLRKTAFRNQDARPRTPPDPLEKVAEAIVTRDCQGMPLPIVTAATQLAMLGTHPNAWHTLRGNLMKKRPLPANANNSDNYNAANMFMLCYNALCFPLKHILLYCCFFPGGRQISISKLQRLCVAEGFVADNGNTTAEEATRNCVEQLIQCQLIVRCAVLGKPETCRVRVTRDVRDLAPLIVEEEYREFFTYTGNSKDQKQHIRRLSITGNSNGIPSSSSDVPFLRSCFVSQLTEKIEPAKISELLIGGHQLVRVLDFTGAQFIEDLPDRLGDLLHLRYLGLRGTKIKELPASVSRLPNLQSLDIRDTEVTSLPSFMMRYGKFRHLHFAGSFVRKVVELRAVEKKLKASNLQTLAGVRATELLLGYLENWTQLRKLVIGRVKGNNSAKLWACINLMKSLRSLTIKTHGLEKLQLAEIELSPPLISLETLKIGGRTESILSNFGNFFPSLTRLYLWDSMIDEDPFECLKSLEKLVILCLSNACCRKEMKCCKGWFPKLKKLSIQRMRDLEWLKIEEEGMASLEMFFVGYCPKLKLKPKHEVESETVRHLDSLHKLKLLQISRMSLDYAKEVTKAYSGRQPPYSIHMVQPDDYHEYLKFENSKPKDKQRKDMSHIYAPHQKP